MAYQEYYLLPGKQGWYLKKPGILQPFRTFESEEEAKAFAQSLISSPEVRIRYQDTTGQWKDFGVDTED